MRFTRQIHFREQMWWVRCVKMLYVVSVHGDLQIRIRKILQKRTPLFLNSTYNRISYELERLWGQLISSISLLTHEIIRVILSLPNCWLITRHGMEGYWRKSISRWSNRMLLGRQFSARRTRKLLGPNHWGKIAMASIALSSSDLDASSIFLLWYDRRSAACLNSSASRDRISPASFNEVYSRKMRISRSKACRLPVYCMIG